MRNNYSSLQNTYNFSSQIVQNVPTGTTGTHYGWCDEMYDDTYKQMVSGVDTCTATCHEVLFGFLRPNYKTDWCDPDKYYKTNLTNNCEDLGYCATTDPCFVCKKK